MKKINEIYIYCLIDPNDNLIKYIGKTKNKSKRYYEHIRRCRDTTSKKNSWILSLLYKDQKPIMEIIDIVDSECDNFWESHYISLYRSWGV